MDGPSAGEFMMRTDPMDSHVTAARRRHEAGFTLVEIMIAVVIIGLLAALAIPAGKTLRERTLATRMANDFRQFETAFHQYTLHVGTWPAETTTEGEIPTNMAGYLPAAWAQQSAMGGGYNWSGTTGQMRLVNTRATDVVMRRIDAILDDGNLATGDFTGSGSGPYVWQLR